MLISVVAFLPGCGQVGDPEARPAAPATQLASHSGQESVALAWNVAAVEGARKSGIPGPAVARALAIVHTCAYDAWAAYDDAAVGTRLGASLRRPAGEHTLANQEKAISFAAYRAAVDLFPNSKATVFDPLMTKLGYDPKDTSTSKTTASGIGNVACKAVLNFRHGDGSNQLGNVAGGKGPYSDYTGYKPVNAPMDMSKAFDPATVKDQGRWQPLTYVDDKGATVTPEFVTPHWNKVVPFAMTSGSQLRAPGPEKPGTERFKAQAQALVDTSANLTEQQKVIVKYWAEEPPPPQWNAFAQVVSRRDRHGSDAAGTEKDVKMFFALNNAGLDASIACWADKVHFDYVRPITAVRSLFRGQKIKAWGGPGKGTQEINGEAWLPYHPATFPTPPFAEYGSGHSVFGGSASELLKLFTGSDNFGHSVTIKAGAGGYEPGVPAADVTLTWPTLTAAGDEQGISRRYGGMHFEDGDLHSRAQGRQVAGLAWAKAQSYFDGSAVAGAVETLPRTE
jgi:hypothetical protein